MLLVITSMVFVSNACRSFTVGGGIVRPLDFCQTRAFNDIEESWKYTCGDNGTTIIEQSYSDGSCSTLTSSEEYEESGNFVIQSIDCSSAICGSDEVLNIKLTRCSSGAECNEESGCSQSDGYDDAYYVIGQCVSDPYYWHDDVRPDVGETFNSVKRTCDGDTYYSDEDCMNEIATRGFFLGQNGPICYSDFGSSSYNQVICGGSSDNSDGCDGYSASLVSMVCLVISLFGSFL